MAEPVVTHTLTQADLDAAASGGGLGAKLGFKLTQAVVFKAVMALLFAALSFYYLHTGRRNNDGGRLFWAAVFGVLTLVALSLP